MTILTISTLLILTSCVKHDEIEFEGELVDVRFCASSSEMRNQGAYFVCLDTPDDLGKSYTSLSGKHYENVVMLFDPGCRIYQGDKLSGAFYLDKNYGRANCGSWSDVDVPEGVFTSVSVD